MDQKAKKLIELHHGRINDRSFEENDVHSLLILLREHSKRNTPVREVADFIAHREKDRGLIHKYILKSRTEFNKAYKNQSYQLTVKEVFSEEELLDSINKTLNKLGFDEFPTSLSPILMLCVISLMTRIKIIIKNTAPAELEIAFEDDQISLYCNLPIPHKSGKGDIFFKFVVLSAKCAHDIFKNNDKNKPLSSSKFIIRVTVFNSQVSIKLEKVT